MKESTLRNYIRKIVREIQTELDEANTTANIDGYQTPYAFDDGSDKNKKKKKEISTQLGYQLMDADLDLTEGRINRWHEIRKEATQNPSRKLAKGLREIKWQLREMGKFLNWYNRVKEMNELSSQTYLKTTHRDVSEIKDRLRTIQQEIQKLGSL
jgi:hypothetical protein